VCNSSWDEGESAGSSIFSLLRILLFFTFFRHFYRNCKRSYADDFWLMAFMCGSDSALGGVSVWKEVGLGLGV